MFSPHWQKQDFTADHSQNVFPIFCLRYSLFGFVPPGLANFPDKWYVEVQSVLWPAEKAKELLPLSVGFYNCLL